MAAFDYLSPEQQAEAYYLYQKYRKEQRKKRNHTLAFLGVMGANVLGAKAALAKSDKQTTPEQLRRRKALQAKLSTGAAVTGLAGLAGIGASSIIRHKPQTAAKIVPALKNRIASEGAAKVADDLKDKSYVAGALSTGIGSVGSLNFASIQRAEAKKRKQFKPNQ